MTLKFQKHEEVIDFISSEVFKNFEGFRIPLSMIYLIVRTRILLNVHYYKSVDFHNLGV